MKFVWSVLFQIKNFICFSVKSFFSNKKRKCKFHIILICSIYLSSNVNQNYIYVEVRSR